MLEEKCIVCNMMKSIDELEIINANFCCKDCLEEYEIREKILHSLKRVVTENSSEIIEGNCICGFHKRSQQCLYIYNKDNDTIYSGDNENPQQSPNIREVYFIKYKFSPIEAHYLLGHTPNRLCRFLG